MTELEILNLIQKEEFILTKDHTDAFNRDSFKLFYDNTNPYITLEMRKFGYKIQLLLKTLYKGETVLVSSELLDEYPKEAIHSIIRSLRAELYSNLSKYNYENNN